MYFIEDNAIKYGYMRIVNQEKTVRATTPLQFRKSKPLLTLWGRYLQKLMLLVKVE